MPPDAAFCARNSRIFRSSYGTFCVFLCQLKIVLRPIPDARLSNESATSSGRGLVDMTTPTDLHWRDVIKVPRTLRYVVAIRYEVSEINSIFRPR